jgi:hypothetical protein
MPRPSHRTRFDDPNKKQKMHTTLPEMRDVGLSGGMITKWALGKHFCVRIGINHFRTLFNSGLPTARQWASVLRKGRRGIS